MAKRWTAAKRRRAREKANVALRRRRAVREQTKDRSDTQYAGLIPMARYGEELKLRSKLNRTLEREKGKTSVYQPAEEAMAYLVAQLAGIVRLSHLDELLTEGVIVREFGLPGMPSEDTQRRFLQAATEGELRRVDRLTAELVQREAVARGEGAIWVGGDVTGIPSRGYKREGARMGYCGGKKRLCFQMLRVCVQGLAWWSELRPGNDAGKDVFDQALKLGERLAQKYPQRTVYVRQDSGGASEERLKRLIRGHQQHSNLEFVAAVPRHNLSDRWWQEQVGEGRQGWRRMNRTTVVKHLGTVRVWGLETGVAAVAVREMKWRQRKDKGVGAPRFRVSREVGREYLIVSSVEPERKRAKRVFQLYHSRQGEELSIKDGKQSLAVKALPAKRMMANRMHIKMVGLAQVIGQLFLREVMGTRPAGGEERREETSGMLISTFRRKAVRVGGENQGTEPDRVGATAGRVSDAEAHRWSGAKKVRVNHQVQSRTVSCAICV